MNSWRPMHEAPILQEILVYSDTGLLLLGVLNQQKQFIQYYYGKAITANPLPITSFMMWSCVPNTSEQEIYKCLLSEDTQNNE